MMQTINGAGMHRLLSTGTVVVALVAQVAHAQTAATTRVTAQGRPDSVQFDSVRSFVATTRAAQAAMRAADRRKLDSLIQVRERLPVGSSEIRSVEEEIIQVMLASMPAGTGFVGVDGRFSVFVQGDRSTTNERVMVASKAFRPDVAPRGYIGFTVDGATIRWQDATGDYVQYAEYPTVMLIEPNSPAARVGIRFGDSLVAYNGVDVRRNSINLTRLLEPGRTVDLLLHREGEQKELSVVVEKAPAGYMTETIVRPLMASMPSRAAYITDSMVDRRATEMRARGAPVAGARGGGVVTPRAATSVMAVPYGLMGAQLTDVESAGLLAISRKKTAHGVLVAKVPSGSPAARIGLTSGDIITAAGDVQITSLQQLRQVVMTVGPETRLVYVVIRDGKAQKLTYEPK